MSAAMDRQGAAIAGAACAGLSRAQKRKICMAAERAWHNQGCPLWEPDANPEYRLSRTGSLELWRHLEQERLTGRKHLTQCGQADYQLLLSHFLALAGDMEGAAAAAERMAGDDTRRAAAVLRKELTAAQRYISSPRRYVAVIAASKFKRDLHQLTPRELWTLIFDLRRAVSARKKKAKNGEAIFD